MLLCPTQKRARGACDGFGWCVYVYVCASQFSQKHTGGYTSLNHNGHQQCLVKFLWFLRNVDIVLFDFAVEAWRSQVIQHKACVVKALTPKVIWQFKAFHSRSFNQQCLFTFPLLYPSVCYDFFVTLCSPLDVVGLRRKKKFQEFLLFFCYGII